MDKSTIGRRLLPRGRAYCDTPGTACYYGVGDVCVNCGRQKGWRVFREGGGSDAVAGRRGARQTYPVRLPVNSELEEVTVKFKIKILHGPEVKAEVVGVLPVNQDHVTVADMEAIIPTEQLLERLTGLRVHIEQVE